MTMSELLAEFATVSTAVFEHVVKVCNSITTNKLILFTTGFLFLGGCIGILRRLLSRS